ncbi:glycerophosphoryl diester phosphodiesterase [Lyophyllum atratum]|nr:glycerophosphoryl diester phosphodiesterase [Lyophyllum atratum]
MVKFFSSLLFAGLAAVAHAHPRVPRVEVQAHRGGLGLRPESTLQAFAYALEIGAEVLEMDTVFTKDGVPVIWHDHRISELKCRDTATGGENFPFVGQLIANLTLAELKEASLTVGGGGGAQTLDCGSLQLEKHRQAKLFPGAQIPTLEEVLELVKCYGDDEVQINLETKIDPTTPDETLPLQPYIDNLVPILKKHRFDKRAYIQSFDWRTLIGIKEKFPEIRLVALLDDTTVVPADDGTYPWLGGIDVEEDFDGDWIKAARSIGAVVLSPVHGVPSGSSVNTPGYVPFTTADVVERAHELGMQVIPWTVDDESTISKLMDDGVDAIISNYPERVKFVGRDRGISVGKKSNKPNPKCLKNAALSV